MIDDLSKSLALSAVMELLRTGDMEIRGLLPGSSNYTFLAAVRGQEQDCLAVYKPIQGESPLWDFPHGTLSNRELAAFLVSETLNWRLVPPTVLRIGPYGRGAVQLFINADFQQHYFTFRDESSLRLALQRIAAFDLIINNADRKSGHCLLDSSQHVWAIDHGVCFHVQPKLRTVIWDFAGEALPAAMLAELAGLRTQLDVHCDLYGALDGILDEAEIRALARRTERLLDLGKFPAPDLSRRSYPW
ncbi:MAG: SCO1664 family protein, partial [Anaerolineae bacterium]